MNRDAKPAPFTLPTRLSFAGKGEFKPGRGEAGWTVYAFATAEERSAFMARHMDAAMPCWKRIGGAS